eukprot:comp17405_c0_seq1/m.29363 comp17405_c0_seq1/g.29363  ORF comp17405_c0_seq1/g.29363 comp17405_c0_seq1/m.29363 type:complete len:257 (+) comp17405_c0_seq1:21-791(+)
MPVEDPAANVEARPGEEGAGLNVTETRLSNLGHQEVSRILEELETISRHLIEAAGPETWLAVHAARSLVIQGLGYEDEDELEDAIKGDFSTFIQALPHIETKIQEEETSVKGMLVMRARLDPPLSQRRGFMKVITIRTTQDLWRVLSKSDNARIEIPAIEFEISADNKRRIDTIYNHIANAIFNLGNHVRMVAGVSEEHKTAIMETVMALNAMLDVEVPWTLVVHDDDGLSQFWPETDIDTVFTTEAPVAEAPSEA